jgi:hypothetical protein
LAILPDLDGLARAAGGLLADLDAVRRVHEVPLA